MSPATKSPTVYILANRRNGTLYIGVTANLLQRMHQHRTGTPPGWAHEQGCTHLVYFEQYEDMPTAIAREKQLKAGSRAKKLALIESNNSAWKDLYPGLLQ